MPVQQKCHPRLVRVVDRGWLLRRVRKGGVLVEEEEEVKYTARLRRLLNVSHMSHATSECVHGSSNPQTSQLDRLSNSLVLTGFPRG